MSTMDSQKIPNLSKEQNLIKECDGVESIPGYVVVVFKKLKNGGLRFFKTVSESERFKGLIPFWNSPQNYFAVAVNASVLAYSFEESVTLDDEDIRFNLIFHLRYRAANPQKLAELNARDPLRQLCNEIRKTISHSCRLRKREMIKDRFRELERIMLNSELSKLSQYAATWGIEIITLNLDRRLPAFEAEIETDAINRGQRHINYALTITDSELLEALNALKELLKSRHDENEGSDAVTRVSGDVLTTGRRISSSKDETNNQRTDTVACSVFAPPKVPRGSNVLIQVFAHLPNDQAMVKSLAREFDDKTRRLAFKHLDHEIVRHTKLVFCLSMPGVRIDEPTQELLWRGQSEAVQFGVYIPEDIVENEIIGTIQVAQDSVPFGRLKFLLKIEDVGRDSLSRKQQCEVLSTWKRYEYAFISYASEDRLEVLKRVQMLARLHIGYFQDLLTLEPGERWKKKIYEHIDCSDVFFLFWSSAARNSEWVMKEVRYALKRKRTDKFAAPEIVPVIIEGPPPVPPPDELRDIHFNDVFMYFIN